MLIEERSSVWQLSNPGGMCTSTSFPSQVPQLLPPNQNPPGQGVIAQGDGVVPFVASGVIAPTRAFLCPFGQGAAGSTFSVNAYLWKPTTGSLLVGQGMFSRQTWIPILMASYNVTLGSQVGAQNCDIGPMFNFAQTITQTYGVTSPAGTFLMDEFLLSAPAGNIGMISLRLLSAQFLGLTFQLGTATGANCLVAAA